MHEELVSLSCPACGAADLQIAALSSRDQCRLSSRCAHAPPPRPYAAEYRPRGRRRGRFEITSPDDDEVVDLEEEAGIEERHWTELIQPRLLHP